MHRLTDSGSHAPKLKAQTRRERNRRSSFSPVKTHSASLACVRNSAEPAIVDTLGNSGRIAIAGRAETANPWRKKSTARARSPRRGPKHPETFDRGQRRRKTSRMGQRVYWLGFCGGAAESPEPGADGTAGVAAAGAGGGLGLPKRAASRGTFTSIFSALIFWR
jgi:hypothetical protein